jgi:hypothetical protein
LKEKGKSNVPVVIPDPSDIGPDRTRPGRPGKTRPRSAVSLVTAAGLRTARLGISQLRFRGADRAWPQDGSIRGIPDFT